MKTFDRPSERRPAGHPADGRDPGLRPDPGPGHRHQARQGREEGQKAKTVKKAKTAKKAAAAGWSPRTDPRKAASRQPCHFRAQSSATPAEHREPNQWFQPESLEAAIAGAAGSSRCHRLSGATPVL